MMVLGVLPLQIHFLWMIGARLLLMVEHPETRHLTEREVLFLPPAGEPIGFLCYQREELNCIIRRRSPDHPPVSSADSEARSVFVSQLAARMTARDLGYFFEEKLGEGSVLDPRIVMDCLSRHSKG